MKLFVLILFVFGSFSYVYPQATGGIQNDTIINYTDILGNKQGKWIKYYSDNKVRYTGFFIDDKPLGVFTYYHLNGQKKSVLNYKKDGSAEVEMFWETGHRAAKGAYNSKRERIGTWELYYTDGSLVSVIEYSDGKANGNVSMFYPGTKIKLLDCNYKNGKLEGSYQKFFKNGSKMEEGPYENGLKHGYYTYYTPDAHIHEEGEYRNGLRVGDWKKYDKGKYKETINYINGRPENYDELMQEWLDKEEWAKQNQDKFRNPEDYFDNPYEFFKDQPDPYEKVKRSDNTKNPGKKK